MLRLLTIPILLCLMLASSRAFSRESFWEFWQNIQTHNAEIKALEAEQMATESRQSAALGTLLPKIWSEAKVLQQTQEYAAAVQRNRGTQLAVVAEQNIFDLKAWNEHRLAETEGRIGLLLLENRKSDLRLSVLQAYWHAMILDERVRRFHTLYEPLIRQINAQGELAIKEALRSRQEQAQWLLGFHQLQLQALQLQDELASQLDQLQAWASANPFRLLPRKADFKPDARWLYQVPPNQKTPAQQLVELTLKKAEINLNESRAAFLPRLYLFADWQQFLGSTDVSSPINGAPVQEATPVVARGSTFGLGMQWTLFEGFSSFHRNRSAASSMEAASQRLRVSHSQQALQFDDQKRRLQSTLSRFEQLIPLRQQTQEALQAVLDQQKAGMTSFDAVIPALNQAFEAETLYYQAMQSFFDIYWKMLRDLGKLDDLAIRDFAESAFAAEQ